MTWLIMHNDEKYEISIIAKQMARTNQDVVGEKCIRNDHGDVALYECAKEEAWKYYYSRLLNEDWDQDDLSSADLILGPQLG